MKKILLSIVFIMFSVGLSYAGHTTSLQITENADLYTSTVPVSANDLSVEGKIINKVPKFNPPTIYLDIATASYTAYASSSTRGLAVSGLGTSGSITLTTLVSGGTTWTLAKAHYTNTITPRNVVVMFMSTSSVVTAACHSTCTVTVTGYNALGEADTETITAHESTQGVGVKAWSSITSYAISAATMTFDTGYKTTRVCFNIGSGTKIGLPFDLHGAGEVYKVIENGGLSSDTSYSLNGEYNTITFNSAPNGSSDYQVWSKPRLR